MENRQFVKGVPSETGYYWFRRNGRTELCRVVREDAKVALGAKPRVGVLLLTGWRNPDDDRFSVKDPWVTGAEYLRIEEPT